MKLNIIYWSGTGNTKQMAELIKEGAAAAAAGAEVNLIEVSGASPADAEDCDVLALGCSSMGDEVLEESEFEPYMQSIEGSVAGKKIGLFGSYGWGDGQWMRDWDVRIKNASGNLAAESLIVNEYPEGEEAERCKEFGKKLVSA